MKKKLKKICSLAAAVSIPVQLMVFPVFSDAAEIADCYADTREIVIEYSGSVEDSFDSDSVTLLCGEEEVNVIADVAENLVTLTPADGEQLKRDSIYCLTLEDFTEYFKIETVTEGIDSSNISRDSGKTGASWGGGSVLDDGYYVYNCAVGPKNTGVEELEDYTVSYNMDLYTKISSVSEVANSNVRVYHAIMWNSQGLGSWNGGYGILFDYDNSHDSQTLKTLEKSSSNRVPTDVLAKDCIINKQEAGVVLWNGTDNITVIQPSSRSYDIRLKKRGAEGSVYIDNNFIYKYEPEPEEGEELSKTGYFAFGITDAGGVVMRASNFLITKYVPIEIKNISVTDCYADTDEISIDFNDILEGELSGNGVTLSESGKNIDIDLSTRLNKLIIRPKDGKLKTDVMYTLTIDSGFGTQTYKTDTQTVKMFKIETLMDKITNTNVARTTAAEWGGAVFSGDKYIVKNSNMSPVSGIVNTETKYSVKTDISFYSQNDSLNNRVYLDVGWNNSKTEGLDGHAFYIDYDSTQTTRFLKVYDSARSSAKDTSVKAEEYGIYGSTFGILNWNSGSIDITKEPEKTYEIKLKKLGTDGELYVDGKYIHTYEPDAEDICGYLTINTQGCMCFENVLITACRMYDTITPSGISEPVSPAARVSAEIFGKALVDNPNSAVSITDVTEQNEVDDFLCTLSADGRTLFISAPNQWKYGHTYSVSISAAALKVNDDIWNSLQGTGCEFLFTVAKEDIHCIINDASGDFSAGGSIMLDIGLLNSTNSDTEGCIVAAVYGEDAELLGMKLVNTIIRTGEHSVSVKIDNIKGNAEYVKIHLINSVTGTVLYCTPAMKEVR